MSHHQDTFVCLPWLPARSRALRCSALTWTLRDSLSFSLVNKFKFGAGTVQFVLGGEGQLLPFRFNHDWRWSSDGGKLGLARSFGDPLLCVCSFTCLLLDKSLFTFANFQKLKTVKIIKPSDSK